MQPTASQLSRFAADLHAKHDPVPGMARRIDRAVALAAAGDVRAQGRGYLVLSARNDGTGYHLDGRGRCTCPDFHGGAPQIRGITFCKHRLAFNMVHRALVEALAPRILGNGESGNRKHQRSYPNTFLLLISRKGRSSLWSDRDGLVGEVIWSRSLHGWMPASQADMVRLDRWLSQAQPLSPVPTDLAADGLATEDQAPEAALVAQWDDMLHSAEEWQPAWSPAAHRHWLNTGTLPATRQLDALVEF